MMSNKKDNVEESFEKVITTQSIEKQEFVTHLREPYELVKGHKNIHNDFNSSYCLKSSSIIKDTSFTAQIISCRTKESLDVLIRTLSKYQNIEALQILDCELDNIAIRKLISNLEDKKYFKKLIIYDCGIKELLSDINRLAKLESLDLSRNRIRTLPDEILDLKSLRYLGLYQNSKLHKLPQEIGQLSNLEFLGFGGCNIKEIPSSIGLLQNLTALTANSTNLEIIPIEIGDCKNLKHLNLSHNRIKSFPKEIGNLLELEYLTIGSNQHDYVPIEYKNLKKLHHFN